jgi:hypothetical protein
MTTTCPASTQESGSARCKSRKPPWSWSPRPPSKDPSLSNLCSPKGGVLTPVSRHLEEGSIAAGRVGGRRSKRGMGAHLVHEHQPPVWSNAQPWSATPTSATRPVRSLLPIFFSAVPQALDRPADRRLAHPNPTDSKKELASLLVVGPWPSFEVFLKQPHSSLVQLRTPALPALAPPVPPP